MIAPLMSHASTNMTEHLPPHLKQIAGVAASVAALPGLSVRRASVWEGGWHLFSTDMVVKIDGKGRVEYAEIATNQFTRKDAYYQQFTLAESFDGYVKYGSFPTPEEAHSAFLYATTTTASPWHSDAALAAQLTPKPDEVLFADGKSLIFRRGAICVHVAVLGVPAGDASMKHVVQIANRILAEIAAAETGK